MYPTDNIATKSDSPAHCWLSVTLGHFQVTSLGILHPVAENVVTETLGCFFNLCHND